MIKEKPVEEMIKNVPSVLPEGWRWVRLGDFSKTTSGGTPSRSNSTYWLDGEIPWIKSGELKDTYIDNSEEKVTKLGLEKSNAKIFPSGTLLIAMYGATVGKTGCLSINASTNQAICAIFPDEKRMNKHYLWEYLKYIRLKIIEKSFGGAQPNISQDFIRKLLLPLPFKNNHPDLQAQKKVVAKITDVFKKIARAEKLRQTALEKTKITFDAVLTKIFKEADEDKGWKTVTLGVLADINKASVNPKKDFPTKQFTYIDINSIENGTGLIKEPKVILGQEAPSRARRLIKVNDVLMATVRPYLKGFAVVPDQHDSQVCSTGFAVLSAKKDVDPTYLYHVLFSDNLMSQYQKMMTGASYPALNSTQVRSLLIKCPYKDDRPDLARQKSIVNRLSSLSEKTKQLDELQTIQLTKFTALKESILNKAFRGELSWG